MIGKKRGSGLCRLSALWLYEEETGDIGERVLEGFTFLCSSSTTVIRESARCAVQTKVWQSYLITNYQLLLALLLVFFRHQQLG